MSGGVNFNGNDPNKYESVIKRYDYDGDGKTTVDELVNQSIFNSYSDLSETANSIFQKYAQADGDDTISAKEYEEAINSDEYKNLFSKLQERTHEALMENYDNLIGESGKIDDEEKAYTLVRWLFDNRGHLDKSFSEQDINFIKDKFMNSEYYREHLNDGMCKSLKQCLDRVIGGYFEDKDYTSR